MRAVTSASLPALVLGGWLSTSNAWGAPIVFGATGAMQSYAVPITGLYDVIAFGAQGGDSYAGPLYGGSGGAGAQVGGDLMLTAGDLLTIAVGRQGALSLSAGGGGGSFVIGPGGVPLVIAGGGGGAADVMRISLPVGQPGGPGLAGSAGADGGGAPGDGGSSGKGGGTADAGAGGGGFDGSGASATSMALVLGAVGGGSYADGLSGGKGAQFVGGGARIGNGGDGGFGGGGGGGLGSFGNSVGFGAGGGGGFSGGGGGTSGGVGGGGGSFLASTVLSNADRVQLSGVNFGDGLVTIERVGAATAVPEPGSALPLAAAVAWMMRRRRR